MRTTLKLALTMLSAMLLIGLGSGMACALRSLSLNQPRNTATSRALVISSPEIEGFAMTCEASLEIEEVVPLVGKRRGHKFWNIIRAIIHQLTCRGGTARALEPTRATPWEAQYESFSGSLPTVTLITISVHGTAILMELLGTRCLFGGTINFSLPVTGPETTREVRSLTVSSSPSVPLIRDLRGLIACPRSMNMSGSFELERPMMIRLT